MEPTRAPTAISRRCCSSCSSLRSCAFTSRACTAQQHASACIVSVRHGVAKYCCRIVSPQTELLVHIPAMMFMYHR